MCVFVFVRERKRQNERARKKGIHTRESIAWFINCEEKEEEEKKEKKEKIRLAYQTCIFDENSKLRANAVSFSPARTNRGKHCPI